MARWLRGRPRVKGLVPALQIPRLTMPMLRRPHSPIVANHRVLDFDYIPERLPHRQEQMDQLAALFEGLFGGPVSQRALLKGSTGTGKTTLAKRFCIDLQALAAAEGRTIRWLHINCRRRATTQGVLQEIVNSTQDQLPVRGFSVSELLDILKKDLRKQRASLVVVLDEVDALIARSGSELIYQLSRFDEEEKGLQGSLSLLLVSQRNVLELLDAPTLSAFKRGNIVNLDRYTVSQLLDIVTQRAGLALIEGAAPPEVLALIAEAAGEYGDARFAIELLERSAAAATQEGVSAIGPEHVRAAKAVTKAEGITNLDELELLSPHQRLVLLGIARALRTRASLTTGQAEVTYRTVCEEVQEPPRAHTQFSKYLKELDGLGMINAQRSSGADGTTTIIRLVDAPAIELVRALEGLLPRSGGNVDEAVRT